MSAEILIIEQTITQALATAIIQNVETLKAQNSDLQHIIVNGLFLENPSKDGTAGKRRDINPPGSKGRINILCNPNIPKGYGSVLRTCAVNITCITHPDSDPEQRLAAICYKAVRKVFDLNEFQLPTDRMELRGFLITDGSAGITEEGFVVLLGIRFEVFIKQTGV